jgi:hypothetical protein
MNKRVLAVGKSRRVLTKLTRALTQAGFDAQWTTDPASTGADMITAPVRMTRAGPGARPRPWAAYAAATWALTFAVPHFYWGMGGTTGLTTSLNKQILDHRTAGFLAGNFGIGAFCVVGGLVALATVRPWGRRLPRGALRALAWFGVVLLAARVLDIYVEFGFGLTGITTVAAGERAEFLRLARWFLFLWLPWFTLGAVAWGALATRLAHQASHDDATVSASAADMIGNSGPE